MSAYYLDTSAALKLLIRESHTHPFRRFYQEHADAAWVSSALLRMELLRTVQRTVPEIAAEARELLTAVVLVAIDDQIIEAAIAEPMLRSLDAIHLATARILAGDLDGLATYDDRLAAAATGAGVAVVSPRD